MLKFDMKNQEALETDNLTEVSENKQPVRCSETIRFFGKYYL